MEDRSAGISLSKEDYNLLYGGGVLKQIHKDTYKDMIYEITAKDFPYIEIISKLYISIFSGSKQVILKDDKKTYELQRECMVTVLISSMNVTKRVTTFLMCRMVIYIVLMNSRALQRNS